MTLNWKTTTIGTPPKMHYAEHDGARYEVTGAARSYSARVYRIDRDGSRGRMLAAYDDDTPAKCKAWCQRFETERTASRAKAGKVRGERPPRPKRQRQATTVTVLAGGDTGKVTRKKATLITGPSGRSRLIG
jgi:hypothetical protein